LFLNKPNASVEHLCAESHFRCVYAQQAGESTFRVPNNKTFPQLLDSNYKLQQAINPQVLKEKKCPIIKFEQVVGT